MLSVSRKERSRRWIGYDEFTLTSSVRVALLSHNSSWAQVTVCTLLYVLLGFLWVLPSSLVSSHLPGDSQLPPSVNERVCAWCPATHWHPIQGYRGPGHGGSNTWIADWRWEDEWKVSSFPVNWFPNMFRLAQRESTELAGPSLSNILKRCFHLVMFLKNRKTDSAPLSSVTDMIHRILKP